MRYPPRLSDATLRAAILAHYHISVAELVFLPIGNDVSSFVYRITASDGTPYLLKVRSAGAFSPTSLTIPHYLHAHGVPHIVAPLPTTGGALWVQRADFALSLAPFIDARTAADTGLSEQQWCMLGATLRQIHSMQLPPELYQIVPHETFMPSRRQILAELEPELAERDQADPIARELALFWHARRDAIQALIERAALLGEQLRHTCRSRVLCHADFHAWNVLIDAQGQLWIVDWDETILAPKERDLMFVIDGIARGLVSAHETASFLRGYGDEAIDRRALAYYRYAWAVQEMGAYAEEILNMPERDEHARHEALHSFVDLFAPGNIVAISRAADSSRC